MIRDNVGNILGDNTADNQFNSTAVVSNVDGSLIERIEFVQANMSTGTRTIAKKTAATPVTQNLFTVSGGAVRILAIVVQN